MLYQVTRLNLFDLYRVCVCLSSFVYKLFLTTIHQSSPVATNNRYCLRVHSNLFDLLALTDRVVRKALPLLLPRFRRP